jgi:translation initiation factor IF-2
VPWCQVTDIAIIVIAADDDIMRKPKRQSAMRNSRCFSLFAINKVDNQMQS